MTIYLPVIQTVIVLLLLGLPLDPVDSVDLGVPWPLMFPLPGTARRGGSRLSKDDLLHLLCPVSETPLALVGGWR